MKSPKPTTTPSFAALHHDDPIPTDVQSLNQVIDHLQEMTTAEQNAFDETALNFEALREPIKDYENVYSATTARRDAQRGRNFDAFSFSSTNQFAVYVEIDDDIPETLETVLSNTPKRIEMVNRIITSVRDNFATESSMQSVVHRLETLRGTLSGLRNQCRGLIRTVNEAQERLQAIQNEIRLRR